MKKYIIMLMIFLPCQFIYSGSISEQLNILNYTGNDLYFNIKHNLKDSNNFRVNSFEDINIDDLYKITNLLQMMHWNMEISGIKLYYTSYFTILSNYIIKNRGGVSAIEYRTSSEYVIDESGNKIRIDTIPFMEKMKAIFEELTIMSLDGNILVDLNNLENQYIHTIIEEEESRGKAYYLVIHDQGEKFNNIINNQKYQKRLASEW